MPTRRRFLKTGALALGMSQFPYIAKAYNSKPTLRVLGTHVTLQEPIRLEAERALGVNIQFIPGGSAEVLLQASTDPQSFDIYEQWSNSIRILWEADAIKPIDKTRIVEWDNINNLTKTGRLSPAAPIGSGDAPHTIINIQADGSLGANDSRWISFLPYVHNVDSFGYNTQYIAQGSNYESESWGWLLNENFRGRVAIVNEPSIGLFDLALAAQARGLIYFNDLANMSRLELDELFLIINSLQQHNHFRGVWRSVPHSVQLMAQGEVIIESMFSPAVSTLNSMGIKCRYAAPKEGYRAWHGVMCLSRDIDSEREDIAYQYMNWWLSGWAGGYIARQGYYIANPTTARQFISPSDWDFWYDGKPAAAPIMGMDGTVIFPEGYQRSGGSYTKRFENIAVWNSVIPNYEYSLIKWNEFLFS